MHHMACYSQQVQAMQALRVLQEASASARLRASKMSSTSCSS